MPCSSVSELCRLRCCLLVRNIGSTTTNINVDTLLEMRGEEALESAISKGQSLSEQLAHLQHSEQAEDATYLIAVVGEIAASSSRPSHLQATIQELLQVCFLDEAMREDYYKAGSEAMGVLLRAQPQVLSAVLKLIDRNVDHLDEYAVVSGIRGIKSSRKLY